MSFHSLKFRNSEIAPGALQKKMRQCGIHRGRLDKWMENSETQLLIFRSSKNMFKKFEKFLQKYFSKNISIEKNENLLISKNNLVNETNPDFWTLVNEMTSSSHFRTSLPYIVLFFFICYHSKEMPFLIDMSMPGLIKIPQVSREAFPGTLDCCCHPGPSFLVARCTSGVPTVQKTPGRKWDIQLNESAARVLFARDEHRFRR